LPAFGARPGDAQTEAAQLSEAGLVRVADALALSRRDADALLARVAAEVARRSGPEFGDVGLARARGSHNPVRLVAAASAIMLMRRPREGRDRHARGRRASAPRPRPGVAGQGLLKVRGWFRVLRRGMP